MKTNAALSGLVALVIQSALVVAAAAQTTYTWTGSSPGDWENASNWSPNGVPGAADSVVIGSGETVLHADTTVAKATLSGGSLSGDGNLTVTELFEWSGGTLNGRNYAETAALTFPAGATLLITGENEKVLRGRDIINDGTIAWEGIGNIVVAWSTIIQNHEGATVDIRNDATLTRSNGSLEIENSGLFVKSAGEGSTNIFYPYGSFMNEGTVRVEVGVLLFSNNASSFSSGGDGSFEVEAGATLRFNQAEYRFDEGSTVSGEGTLRVTSGMTRIGRADMTGPTQVQGGTLHLTSVDPPSELADVLLADGELGGAGTVNINGLLTWSGGFLGARSGTKGVLNLLGGVSAEGDADKYLAGGEYNNAATFTWSGFGDLVVNTGGSFNNLAGATFDIQNNARLTRSNGSLDLTNEGLITKSAGDSTTVIDYPFGSFTNDGEIRVETGTLYIRPQGNSVDTGAWVVLEDALLQFNLHQRTFAESATISGNGTIRFLENGTIVNHATLRPGLSAGVLTVQDDYPAPEDDAVLEIELGGTESATEHDVLDVMNIANLGGVLRLLLVDDYAPTGEVEFTVVTALAVQGAFADIEPPDGYVAEATYNAQDVVVRLVSLEGCADGLAADDGTLALYKFDEPLAGTVLDASGNGLNLVDEGPEVADGHFCGARRFDGVDDRINMDIVVDSLQGSTGWTIEYIARSADSTEVPEMMNHQCGNGWLLFPRSGSIAYGIKSTAMGGNCPWIVGDWSSATAVMDTLWHYYALAWDGDSLLVYRDGVRMGGAPAGGVFVENQSSSFQAWLGYNDFGNDYSAGFVDEIRVSQVARSAAELHDIADALGLADPPVATESMHERRDFALHPPYPNPTAGRAKLTFDLAEAAAVRLAVYDVLGRQVAVLVDEMRAAGRHEVQFNRGNLSSGLYLARLESGQSVATRRLVVTR